MDNSQCYTFCTCPLSATCFGDTRSWIAADTKAQTFNNRMHVEGKYCRYSRRHNVCSINCPHPTYLLLSLNALALGLLPLT